jgi:acyl-CoA synthetase (NDP forming)/RimJ/RimL family protein N-acetyltransferase
VPAAPVDVGLRDGSTVRVRTVQPRDEEQLRDLLAGLTPESRWSRFFSAAVDLDREARNAARVGETGGRGLVAVSGDEAAIVGHAEYLPEPGTGGAEVAFEVAEAWQGRGIATLLLAHLAQAASATGIETFNASVLASNHRMARVFRESGFAVRIRPDADVLNLEMPVALDAGARLRFEDRERRAAAAAVAHVLRPASVALIGDCLTPASIGGTVLRNLEDGGYSGVLHVVRSVAEAPGPVELAIVALDAAAVPQAARECGTAGVDALVVLSAGFDAALHAELLAACRRFGMRLVGPDSLGVLNTDPSVRLNATPAVGAPQPGTLAFGTQSGAYGLAGIAEARRRGLGLSSFVSMGDKADLSGNDLLSHWQDDPGTSAVLLYLESFGNPRRFGRIAREVARRKPVIAVKSGRSSPGRHTTTSQTGALLAASDATVDALFHHAGVIRCDTLGEMLDVAAVVATAPLPAGRRVAVVTNARGPGIACADACGAGGLELAAGLANPIDPIAPEHYARALGALVDEAECDAVIVIAAPTPSIRLADVAAALAAPALRAAAAGIAVVGVFMGQDDAALVAHAAAARIAVFAAPEEAAQALGRLARNGEWRRRAEDIPEPPAGIELEAAAAVLAAALARGGGWLGPDEVAALLHAYGIPLMSPTAAEPVAADGDGVEMIVGVVGDPDFGPVVACGVVGRAVELLGDASVRLAPLGRRDAHDMLRELRTYPLLDGYRGAPKVDIRAVEDLIVRLSALAAEHPEIAELDCNPVLASPAGALVLHGRVRVEALRPGRPFPSLDR